MQALLFSARDLMVAALPTLVLFTLLSIYLKHLFFKPLANTLEERRAATEGTKHAAQNAFEKAKRKAAEYEAAFREARTELYKEQEAFRNELRTQQASALSEMRVKNDSLLAEASARIASETTAAQASIGAEAEKLAEQIAGAVLKGRAN
jgi:F0F1-type ATP synthase membrane subunit b/b'